MFERVGRKLIIDLSNCENLKKEKIEAMQEVVKRDLPTHHLKKVKDGVFEIKFHYKDMLEFMEEILLKAFGDVERNAKKNKKRE